MDNINNQTSTNDYLKFDKRVLLLSLSRKAVKIIVASIIATIVGFIFAKLLVTDTWSAQAVLIRHTKNLSSNTSVPYLYSEMDFSTILQSIKTRKNLQTLIDSLHLKDTPESIYGAIKVTRGRRSNLINIRTKHKDRDKAVEIANVISEVFISSYIEIINSATNKIYHYYQDQIVLYEKKMASKELEMAKFQEEKQVLSLEKEVQNNYDNLRVLELDMMNTQLHLSELNTKIIDIGERIQDLPQKVELTSTITTTYQSQLKGLNAQMSMLKKKYTDKNPKIMKLQDEIDALVKLIANEKDSEKTPDSMTYGTNSIWQSLVLERTRYENETVAITKKVQEYESKIASIKNRLKVLSPIEREYYDISSRKKNLAEMLDKVNERASEAKIAMESNLSDFEILEKAVASEYPEASGRKVIALVMGFMVFLLLSIYYTLKELLDFTVKSKYDIEEVLQIKCLEEIPNIEKVQKPVFYSKLQILYGQLFDYLPTNETALVTVGKDRFSCGATFIIQELVNLALSQNKKILWIESVSETNEEISRFQINNLLYKKSEEKQEYYQLTDHFHIGYFISDEHTFTKVLSQQRVEEIFKKQSEYDVVFWELFNVDFNLQLFKTIASASDLLAFVARFRHSDRMKLARSVRFLKQNSKVPIVGILNNSVKPYFKQ